MQGPIDWHGENFEKIKGTNRLMEGCDQLNELTVKQNLII